VDFPRGAVAAALRTMEDAGIRMAASPDV